MLKKIFSISFIVLTSTASLAETCPTIIDIQTGQFHGWKTLDINSGSPLETTNLDHFKKNVRSFALAEWMENAPEGASHCYYQSNNRDDPLYLNVFLAKENQTIDKHSSNWQALTTNIFHCRLDLESCPFINSK